MFSLDKLLLNAAGGQYHSRRRDAQEDRLLMRLSPEARHINNS